VPGIRAQIVVVLALLGSGTPPLCAQELVNSRARWFVDARFGMFIHWGVYSGAEGVWKGEKLRNDNDYAEWIQYRNRIEKDETGDGKANVFETYAPVDGKPVLSKREEDKNGDGSIDVTSIYKNGKLVRREISDPNMVPL